MISGQTSLSAHSPKPARPERQIPNRQKSGLQHAPATSNLPKEGDKRSCFVKPLDIKVSSSDSAKTIPAFLHVPESYCREQSQCCGKTAAILLSGASGGLVGPSSIYLRIADKIASLSHDVPVLRMSYRYPGRNKYCVSDVVAAMKYLKESHAVSRFVLVGWSFGGAPVFSVGGQDDRVVGCATVASQTAGTEGIHKVARKGVPILLLHGTADRRLSPTCAYNLYERYGHAARGGKREIKLFEGDNHALRRNTMQAEEMFCEFIMKQAGEEIR